MNIPIDHILFVHNYLLNVNNVIKIKQINFRKEQLNDILVQNKLF